MATKPPRVKVPKKASKGELINIKTLVTHNMETGLRKDSKGEKIPRLILNKFQATFNGSEVFSADMHTAVSANPYIAFFHKAEASGTFNFTWTDDNGKTVTASADMAVS
ncbi:MAG: thiosulfate oxidation carrier complex protein SoxZ [Rhodospirillaceae bacterium]|nr:thiosulfate oxidation carrier complex protein SoxZ [Rhodospirillaceae bacterium]